MCIAHANEMLGECVTNAQSCMMYFGNAEGSRKCQIRNQCVT